MNSMVNTTRKERAFSRTGALAASVLEASLLRSVAPSNKPVSRKVWETDTVCIRITFEISLNSFHQKRQRFFAWKPCFPYPEIGDGNFKGAL